MTTPNMKAHNNVTVLAALALPPPIHGQSLINAEIVRRLSGNFSRLQVIDTAPAGRNRNFRYHLGRAAKVLQAASALLRQPLFGKRKFYTLLEAGNGILYNYILVGLARSLGYRIVLHQHSSAHTLAYSRLFHFLTLVGGKSIIHVTLSDFMAKDLRSRYVDVQHTLASNNAGHIPDPGQRPVQRVIGRRLIVGLLGNLNREKGLDTFVDTLVYGRASGLDIKGVLAGPLIGEAAASTMERARRLLGAALEVQGPVYDAEKAAFYRSIDVLFFPTEYIYEAQPLVVLEAMSYGVPVIATHRGYIAEMMGPTGIVIRPEEDVVKTAVQHFKKFIDEPKTLSAEGNASRAQFLTMRQHGSIELAALVDAILSSE